MKCEDCASFEHWHHCYMGNLLDYRPYGAAITECIGEQDSGELWVTNHEYWSQVNYCPFCGEVDRA